MCAGATLPGSLSAQCSSMESGQEMCVQGDSYKGWRLWKLLTCAGKIKVCVSDCQKPPCCRRKALEGKILRADFSWVSLSAPRICHFTNTPRYPSRKWWDPDGRLLWGSSYKEKGCQWSHARKLSCAPGLSIAPLCSPISRNFMPLEDFSLSVALLALLSKRWDLVSERHNLLFPGMSDCNHRLVIPSPSTNVITLNFSLFWALSSSRTTSASSLSLILSAPFLSFAFRGHAFDLGIFPLHS